MGERGQVTCCEVVDVNIVAYARAVWRVVIVAKHTESLALAYGDLCDVGHEIVWRTGWVFTDETARVCADRVEVA